MGILHIVEEGNTVDFAGLTFRPGEEIELTEEEALALKGKVRKRVVIEERKEEE